MKPPICAICDRDFRTAISEGGLVQFTLTPSETEKYINMKDSKISGHPAGLEWFCKDHIEAAKKYKNLTKTHALRIIKSSF